MYLEHIFYSAAIAVFIGLIAWKWKKPDYSWIIIAVVYLPDIDVIFRIFSRIMFKMWMVPISGYYFLINLHGTFHTLAALIVFALLGSLFFTLFNIRPMQGFIYTALGLGAHFFEDALVYSPGYPFLWPLYSGNLGWGILPTALNWFGIANAETLIVGILFLIAAIAIRIYIQGIDWLPKIFQRK
jgi:hypothetical protein